MALSPRGMRQVSTFNKFSAVDIYQQLDPKSHRSEDVKEEENPLEQSGGLGLRR
jgi:hypothetical protein